MTTGNDLDGQNLTDWATEVSPMLVSDSDDSDASDASDDSDDSDADTTSDGSYIPHPTPSGKKRKAAKKPSTTDNTSDGSSIPHPAPPRKKRKAAATPSTTFSSLSVAESSEHIKMFAGYLKDLVSACDPNSPPRSIQELNGLNKDCAQMIQELKKIHRRDWSEPQWKKGLQDSGFVSAFWDLEFVYIDPNF
jgi:hypothetical protein